MKDKKPITILLVEDDKQECDFMKNYINTRDDVKLIGTADSTEKALEYVKTYIPDAIILDIELNDGKGSGLEVLDKINNSIFNVKPIIIITTNISSKRVYSYAHDHGADLIFHKLKNDYSPEIIINNIVLLSKTALKPTNKTDVKNTECINEIKNRISERINRELDLIGIGRHLIGRKYIHDSILYILGNNDQKESVFLHLAKENKKGNSTIGRSIQTSIEHAWKRSSIEDLQKYYTAAVNYNTGVPTPTEFIYYYVDKIKKTI